MCYRDRKEEIGIVGKNQKSDVWEVWRRSTDDRQLGCLHAVGGDCPDDSVFSVDDTGLCGVCVEYVSNLFSGYFAQVSGKSIVPEVLEPGSRVVSYQEEIFAGS